MANPDSMLVPGDFQVGAETLARKRKVMEAMAKRAQEGAPDGQMVSGHYIAPHWTEHLATLGNAYFANKGNKKLDEEEAQLNQRYQEGLGGAVQDYLQTKNGGEMEVENQGPMPDGSNLPGSTKHQMPGDPRTAIVNAMTSQYKPLQQLGAAELGALGKSSMGAKDFLGLAGYSPRSKVAAALSGDASQLEGDGKTHVIGGKLVREKGDETAPSQIGDFSEKYGELGVVGYDGQGRPIQGQKAQSSGKLEYAPGGGTVVNVDTKGRGGQKFAEAIGQGSAEAIIAGAETAKKAQANFEVFSNAASVVDQVKGGFGAEGILAVKKLAQQLGAPIDDSVSSTEQVIAALGTAVLENSKALGSGSGFSNTDREFLEKIVLGKIALDHTSLRRAVNIGLASSLNTLRSHDKKWQAALKQEGADPQALEQFRVAVPNFSLDFEENFGYDHATDRVTVRTGEGKGAHPVRGRASPTAPNTAPKTTGGYTDAHEKRRQELILQLGAGK